MQRISKVASVYAAEGPQGIAIQANGIASTGGWSSPALLAWKYVATPKDGIQDFDFCAVAPGGPAIEVETAISATILARQSSKDYWGKGIPLAGVRIHALLNKIEEGISPELKLNFLKGLAGGGDARPWPWLPLHLSKAHESGAPSPSINDLLGMKLRLLKQGDVASGEFDVERVNISVDEHSARILDIKIG